MTQKEQWKKIKEFPNYSVSNRGRVRNDNTNRILKQQRVGMGKKENRYLAVCLFNVNGPVKHKLIYVSRLVADAFIPNPTKLRNIGFKDFNKLNCNVDNIYRSSQSKIIRNSWAAGRCNITRANGKLNFTKVRKIRKSDHLTGKELAKIYGVSENAISKVRTNRTWVEDAI